MPWFQVGFWQKEAKGKSKVKQRISMEAKKPRLLKETLIFIRKTDLTEIKERMRKCRKFGLESFTTSVKNALASSWLLTKGSQGEARGEAKDFNGSQEAKGFGLKVIFLLNWRLLGK